MKEYMKVKEIINLFSCGTYWQCIGARTGKKLCNTHSKKSKDKYMEMEVVSIFPSFYTPKDKITGTCDYVSPVINIWVLGE